MSELITDLATGLSLIIGIFIFIGAISLWYWVWRSEKKD